eukprot:CAMPEP_0204553538 /NCGR_PEP_ID=MMETSP0661-20131031/27431_1 /ASSEMBLY_ACC=CAM_ASM_000606 /TAXON_ID=109239 /ORGANISM="Alexandrium margalefi, Strain AMGDE01CS-322" /LENGTH=308 /DNA_ID=CAMNT_0051560579 /DNA_START=87 /DNA_END=1013 /DNA_ORIENTATION=-
MFDFVNLDDIDEEGAPQEWEKWQGKPEWQRAPEEDLAVLEDDREEQFAAPDEDVYAYEKLDVPNLPEEDNFDPIGLMDDSVDAIEDRMASYNGQVILNYVSGAYEEYLMIEREREERKAYLDSLHQERLAILDSGKKGVDLAHKDSSKQRTFDRKKFSWREISSPLVGQVHQFDGGAFAESMLTNTDKTFKVLTRVGAGAAMPTSALVQILCTVGNVARPMPTGRMGRNAEWHISLGDVYFPTCFIVDDGKEVFKNIFEGRGGPPMLTHCAAMEINKVAGGLEATKLMETVKLSTEMNRPRRRNMMRV